ncbi:TIR domain-containing protein [Prosthecobacter sp.]|uniref:nSTAND1 domain-containing NTPase n=1 Tax=Prosthecobacter sp. TaxID=1965333 RepID=UPI003782F277
MKHRVFLSYATADRAAVKFIAQRLRQEKSPEDPAEQDIEPWFDEEKLVPGQPILDALDAALQNCDCCIIFIGRSDPARGDLGPWQHAEVRTLISRQIQNPKSGFAVIPLLLPGAERGQRSTLPSFLVANKWVEFRNTLQDDAEAYQQLLAGIRRQPPGYTSGTFTALGPCPYRGLEFFDVSHAPLFFGREAVTQWLVDDIRKPLRPGSDLPRFLAILGSSGSGKSSLARAGLFAALQRGSAIDGSKDWILVPPLRPGPNPLESLELSLLQAASSSPHLTAVRAELSTLPTAPASLHRAARLLIRDTSPPQRLFLLIDQFEEVFTTCEREELRTAFIAALLHAARERSGPVVIALTMRADFYPKVAAYEELARVFDQHQYLVGPMNEQELRLAIEQPALRAGAEFQTGLIDLLLEDVHRQPGALALLQHALLELWNKMLAAHRRTLLHADYLEIGRLEGALERRASTVFHQLTADDQELCRRLFLRLVHPGEGAEDTRRRVQLRELLTLGAPARVEKLIATLSAPDARLIVTEGSSGTTQRPTTYVEVAHETLIRCWSQLRKWLDTDRSGLRTQRRLTEAAREWEDATRPPDLLYTGSRLAAATEWAAAHPGELNTFEQEFLQTSIKYQHDEQEEKLREQRDLAKERALAAEKAKWQFQIATVLGSLALVCAVVAVLYFLQASHDRHTALKATTDAETALAESNRQLDRATVEIGKSWLERARTAQKAGDNLTAIMLAGRSLGFAGYGREQAPLEWQNKFLPLLSQQLKHDVRADAERMKERKAAEDFIPELHPSLLPIWSSPVGAHHLDSVTTIAYSPDGKRLASGSADNTVKLWDRATGKNLAILSAHAERVTSVAFSPDSTRLASGSEDDTIKLWDSVTGKELASLAGHERTVTSVAFSPDGMYLASGSEDKSIKIWDCVSCNVVATLPGHEGKVTCVVFSSDGKRLASGAEDRTVKLWDVVSHNELSAFLGHENRVATIAFSPDGSSLASGADDLTVKVWDCATGKQLATLKDHGLSVTSVAFSPDGRRLASGSWDQTIKVWDSVTYKKLADLRGHRQAVLSVAFSPDGTQLASGSEDRTVKLWDSPAHQELAALSGHRHWVNGVVFSPDGTRFASGSGDGTVKLWDAVTGRELFTFTGHEKAVTCVAFSPDATLLASGSYDNTVRLWSCADGKELLPLRGHERVVFSVAFSPDGKHLASASDDHTIKLWDLATQVEMPLLKGHQKHIQSIAWSPDGRLLASGSDDKTIRFWDPAAGGNPAIIGSDASEVTSVAFSLDGRRLATGSVAGSVKLWSFVPGTEPKILAGHEQHVTSVALSPDGRHLASGSQDKTVKLWDVEFGREIATFRGHQSAVTSIAFSPDGARLISGSRDNTVRVWDCAMTQDLTSLSGHQSIISSVVFSSDGSRLATGSEDKTVKLWDTGAGKELATLQGHADRVSCVSFSPDGTRLASGSGDSAVKLWDCSSGMELFTIPTGHKKGISCVAFNDNGTRVASASFDGGLKVWDAATGKELVSLKGHNWFVSCMSFSPDSSLLASGSGDETVKLWDSATGKELHTFSGNSWYVSSLAFSPDCRRLGARLGGGTVKTWECKTYQAIPGPPDFPLPDNLSVKSPDGQRWAMVEQAQVHILPAVPSPHPDLLHFQQQGLFSLEDRALVWLTNSSLLSEVTFTPQHYRKDELSALSSLTISPEDAAALRLLSMARTSQWRAARAWWAAGAKTKFPELLPRYLTLLLTSARDDNATAVPTSRAELTTEIGAKLTPESAKDLHVSLPLAQHLLKLASIPDQCPDDVWTAFVAKVQSTTPPTWQQNLAAMATEKLKDEQNPSARLRFNHIIQTFAPAAK